MIINGLTEKISTLSLREHGGMDGKRLDWRGEADILALGGEEC
jgi:hypothetical protein